MTPGDVEVFLNNIVLLVIIGTLFLKALLIRRMTPLGGSMALQNAAFAIAYLGVFLSTFLPIFSSDVWSWSVRAVILFVSLKVIWELKESFGGWALMHHEAWLSLKSLLSRRN